MSKEITRREFLKKAVGTTTTLSIGFCIGPGMDLTERVQCKNCGIVNIFVRSYLSCLTRSRETEYCHNCGTNLKTHKHDIACHDYSFCSKQKTTTEKIPAFSNCCQIPFPNHEYVEGTRKPYFSLNDVKF